MRGKRNRDILSASTSCLLLCSIFFCIGLLLGFFLDQLVSAQARAQLSAYLTAYAAFAAEGANDGSFIATFLSYLRYPAIAFAIGFFGCGAILLPILFAVQGFSMSFAVVCFMKSLGRQGALLSLALVGLRSLFVLPCTLYLACTAFRNRERRCTYQARDYLSFCICFGVLLLGTFLDLAIVPKLLQKILC